MKLTLTTLLLLGSLLQAAAQKYTISGYVKDAASSENLIGANVFDKKTLSGTSSNNYGFYSLTLPADSVTLIYSFVGYGPASLTFRLSRDTTINIGLTDQAQLEEIVISATETERIEQVTQMSTVSVPIEQIKSLPALLGEVDVLKALQLLPGVQSGSEGSSGLYVRGGGPDQNLILLDGVPVYNASHLFGFFSVFNPDAINNVQLIKGGFPARYGGRLSSVIDINMKEGNAKEFHGEGSVGIIAAKLTLEGPIIKDKTSFIVSGRRTYIDLLTRPLIRAQTDGATAGYFFYDVNAKVNHKFSNRDRLYLSTYLGDDKFYAKFKESQVYNNEDLEYRTDNGLQWGNLTSALRWNHMYNPKLFSNLTLTYSRYRFDTFLEYEDEYYDEEEQKKKTDYARAAYLSGINDVAAKIDFDYIPSPRHFVRFGANAIRHTFKPGAFNIVTTGQLESPVDTTLGANATYATEYAAYAEDDYEVTEKLKINAGLHLSGFYVNQEFYTSLQPRLAARYFLGNELSVKASYARMTQFIHLLTNSGIGLPTDLWVPATRRIAPQDAQQVALGFAKGLRRKYEISLEGYYKDMRHLIEYKEGASFFNVSGDWQDKVTSGDGRSYGAELLIQKKEGRTTGWLGYTLSKTERQFDNLNRGQWFPYKYDRRHDAAIAVVHHWKERVDLSFDWVFGTGNAITLPVAVYAGEEASPGYNYYPGEPRPFDPPKVYDYGSRNSFRMKAYHRLDTSIAFRKKKRWGERTWTFGLYNAYSRKNPFYIYLSQESEYLGNGSYREKNQFKQVSLFPVIPSFSYSFKF